MKHWTAGVLQIALQVALPIALLSSTSFTLSGGEAHGEDSGGEGAYLPLADGPGADGPGADRSAATSERDELALIPGSLLLVAPGDLSPASRSTFVQLAGGGAGRIVTLAKSSTAVPAVDWQSVGCLDAQRIVVRRAGDLGKPAALQALLEAGGIWLGELPRAVLVAPLMRSLLVAAMERGAVVGAAGEQARALSGMPGNRQGPLLAPRLHLVFGAQDPSTEDTHHHEGRRQPGRIVAALPDGTAIAIHRGRRLALVGKGKVGFAVYRAEEVLVAEQVVACQAQRDLGDPLRYELDYLSWVRRARAAERPLYPPAEPGDPRLPEGSLIVQGGAGVTDATWQRFIDLAGGTGATFVCIPSASEMKDDAVPSSFSARQLEERGCRSVRIVHVAERRRADRDRRLIAAVESADGVWIDGGRTYRFMDRFGDTLAGAAIARVLERGGVVGGSSAGCQVVGDVLVRGDPRTNQVLTDDGYLQGLGLLEGVILDAHFRQRERGERFAQLVAAHPQMLGIGVDEKTALVIRGHLGEVVGANAVTFYDSLSEPVELVSGETYDLVKRRENR